MWIALPVVDPSEQTLDGQHKPSEPVRSGRGWLGPGASAKSTFTVETDLQIHAKSTSIYKRVSTCHQGDGEKPLHQSPHCRIRPDISWIERIVRPDGEPRKSSLPTRLVLRYHNEVSNGAKSFNLVQT